MSSSVTVVYGGGRTINIRTTPTTTLQAVLNNVCEKISSNSTVNPENHALVYNNKPIDLSLTIRFANLPQGAKLKLAPRPGSSNVSKSSKSGGNGSTAAISSSSASGASRSGVGQSAGTRDAPVKVALQIVGSGRIIKDFSPSTTLWDIVTSIEASSGGALNLTNRCRVPEAGSLSPVERGLSYLSGALSMVSGSSSNGHNSEAEDDAEARKNKSGAGTPTRIYQQPVLVVLNKEISSVQEMQSTTLKSLGFSSGSSVMIRLSFRDSAVVPVPAPRPAASQTTASAP
ncbi:Tether containing UBX domain for GLUT4, partial [Coemansia asiatica]